jgi:hypothetical protein
MQFSHLPETDQDHRQHREQHAENERSRAHYAARLRRERNRSRA